MRERRGGLGVVALGDLRDERRRQGQRVTAAGVVIVRQRPGTAKDFVFVGLEDETGRLDVIIPPQLCEGSARSSTATASWPCAARWERRPA